MGLTETEKSDWQRVLDSIPPRKNGETDEEKTARFERRVKWISIRIYHAAKAYDSLCNSRSKRIFKDRFDDLRGEALYFIRYLDKVIGELGDLGAKHAFYEGLDLASEKIDNEQIK